MLEQAWDRLVERDDSLRDRIQHDGLKGELWCPFINLKMLMTEIVEREMVMERSGLEKIFCSPAYEKMKARFWREIIFRLKHNQDASSSETQTVDGQGTETEECSEDYEEGEDQTDEGGDESTSSGCGSSYDFQEYGKQRSRSRR